ncbi:aminotransferase class V-fold PLP-dependent enzyme [Leucothrix sargassi]|nr:aminotransferase class V-fold PLP-dependent enzyme [Leucothrix sargassi]
MSELHTDFIGLDTAYPLVNGQKKRRLHLDGAASPLVMKTAIEARDALLPHYSNSHSFSHASAHICGQAHTWAKQTILDVCGADERYSLVSMGNGTTSVMNNIARRLKLRSAEKPVVLVSAMEHHANDLPHREQSARSNATLIHIPLRGDSAKQGEIDLDALEALLKEHEGKVNYVSFSGVSNVTGIVNPVAEIVALAHRYDVLAILDAAQSAPHMPLELAKNDVDFAAFSGHKVYCAGSPGILIAKSECLAKYPSDEVGGGVISHVDYDSVDYLDTYPQREQAGTKDILGIYSLAKVMASLDAYGYDKVAAHGAELWTYAEKKLSTIEGLVIYGESEQTRLGALTFNIDDIDHGLVASVLNDYFGIAVRNECFCAHPYVSSMVKESLWTLDLDDVAEEDQEAMINRKRGMVRASFSLYNTLEDVDALYDALTEIVANKATYETEYEVSHAGEYRHKHFAIEFPLA